MSLLNAIILMASLFGNSVIIHIVRTDNSMKTTTNYLILNQACADIVITLTQLINMCHYSYLDSLWFGGPLGVITCKICLGAISIPVGASIWILVMIAFDRFYAVTRPLRSSPLSRHLKKAVFLLWLWCLASSVNVLVNGDLEKINQSYYCHLGSVLAGWTAFNITDLTLNFFLPLLILPVLYTIVSVKLWSRDIPGEGTNQNQRQAEAMKTARKVTRMMIVIVALFAVCWLPFFVIVMLQLFGLVKISSVSLLVFITWLAVSYSGLNPYIYFVFNQKFRFGFKKLIGNFLRKIRILNFFTERSQSVELQQM